MGCQVYCEIIVKHRGQIDPRDLKTAVRNSFGNSIELAEAYSRSAIYELSPPSDSICAFDLVRNCFVILRKVSNVSFSTFHLEGSNRTVTVDAMLHAVEEFSNQLTKVLSGGSLRSAYRSRDLTVQLFEDNGRQTGMDGKLVNLASVLRDKFDWKELAPPVTAFTTSMLLIWLGLKKEAAMAIVYSLIIVLVFALGDAIVEYVWARATMVWRLRNEK